jgi:hypothetical protein
VVGRAAGCPQIGFALSRSRPVLPCDNCCTASTKGQGRIGYGCFVAAAGPKRLVALKIEPDGTAITERFGASFWTNV